MLQVGFEQIIFLAVGGVIGYIIGKLAKLLVALFLVIIALGLLGIAFFNINYTSLLGSIKPVIQSLMDFLRSRTELLIGFILGLILGIIR